MNVKIKKEDLIEWLNTINKSLIEDGWEFCGFHNKDYNMVKIRKPYSDNEIKINEDGYKYKSLYPNKMNTKDYLFFTNKGYKIKIEY